MSTATGSSRTASRARFGLSGAWESYDVDRTTSVGQLIAMWVWLLEHDYYHWDTEQGVWAGRADFPQWIYSLGLDSAEVTGPRSAVNGDAG